MVLLMSLFLLAVLVDRILILRFHNFVFKEVGFDT